MLDDRVVAQGKWWYGGEVEYDIALHRLTYNYSANDLASIESEASFDASHEVDDSVNSAGQVFSWCLDGPSQTWSPSFPSLLEAREHLSTYDGKTVVDWG